MLLEAPVYKELFGAVEVYEVQKVLKLDTQTRDVGSFTVKNIPREDIYGILEDMAIVVPMRNEKLQLVDGVLKAIPHQCPIIVVSNSRREGPNLFKQEVDLVKHFYNLTRSRIIMVHQKDAGVAEAFREAGYTEILGENGTVRSGKGEGMLIGILLAKAIGARYVGFVDADNYIPGSVNEYVKDYAAGLLMSESEYSMVRLSWRHKPKVSTRGGLYFKKWGRVSEITNRYMNALFGVATNFETSIIVTGNAGEHAMSLKLAEIMPFSTGYSIEPFELVYLFETFGRWGADPHTEVYDQGVEVFQIETLNPHLHEDKGKEHVRDMILSSLGTIYHSGLATENLKRNILRELRLHGLIGENEEPPKPMVMPPIEGIDVKGWMKTLEDNAETLLRFEV